MKKTLTAVSLLIFLPCLSQAAVVFTEDFSYPDGAFVGNGGWTQNSTISTNPIQVVSGAVTLTTGQDVYRNFSASIPATDGTSAYFAARVTVTAATATGDYFLHFTNGAINPTFFSGRLAAKSTAGGFFFGYSESTNATTTYGTDILTLNTPYNVVVRYGFVSGTLNDTGTVFVTSGVFDPLEGNNIPYVIDAYNGTTAEIGAFTGFGLRQGGATTAPAVVIDNLVIATSFAEVPEPATGGLIFLTALGGLARRRSVQIQG